MTSGDERLKCTCECSFTRLFFTHFPPRLLPLPRSSPPFGRTAAFPVAASLPLSFFFFATPRFSSFFRNCLRVAVWIHVSYQKRDLSCSFKGTWCLFHAFLHSAKFKRRRPTYAPVNIVNWRREKSAGISRIPVSFYLKGEKYIDWIAFSRLFNAPWSIGYGALKLDSNSIHLISLRSVFLFLRIKYVGDWPTMFFFSLYKWEKIESVDFTISYKFSRFFFFLIILINRVFVISNVLRNIM